MIYHVEKILEQIKPMLASHKGDVELLDVDNNQVFILFKGGCVGCKFSTVTIKDLIQKEIQKQFPELSVVDLTAHANGKNPYYN